MCRVLTQLIQWLFHQRVRIHSVDLVERLRHLLIDTSALAMDLDVRDFLNIGPRSYSGFLDDLLRNFDFRYFAILQDWWRHFLVLVEKCIWELSAIVAKHFVLADTHLPLGFVLGNADHILGIYLYNHNAFRETACIAQISDVEAFMTGMSWIVGDLVTWDLQDLAWAVLESARMCIEVITPNTFVGEEAPVLS